MMSADVNVIESILQGNSDKFEANTNPRLLRDAKKDLHEAIDLAFVFSETLKALHPVAESQVKAMIFHGDLL